MKQRTFFSNRPSNWKTETRPTSLLKALSQHFEIPGLEEIEEDSKEISDDVLLVEAQEEAAIESPVVSEEDSDDEPFADPQEETTIESPVDAEENSDNEPLAEPQEKTTIESPVDAEEDSAIPSFLQSKYTEMIISGNTKILSDFISQYKRTRNIKKLVYLFRGNLKLARWISNEKNVKFMLDLPIEIWKIVDETLV